MRILFLAPHPFYQARGTPIAVDMLMQSFARRGAEVDLLTYAEGEDRAYGPSIRIRRAGAPPGCGRGIRPGFSVKKLLNDAWMAPCAMRTARREGPYDVVHAVEEAVFMAMRIRRRYGIPYLFDMDSSMPEQMAEKTLLFRPWLPLMRRIEARAIRNAMGVVAVCEALAGKARAAGARRVFLLHDVSLLPAAAPARRNLREAWGLPSGPVLLYIGNLESYQGMDLLLEALALSVRERSDLSLVVAGGVAADVARYRRRADALGLGHNVRLIGPQPVEDMAALCAGADILVSPRTRGKNTPMKIYSFLDAGRPLLATRLPTHTQVLTDEVALLAEPKPEAFARSLLRLADDPGLQARLADNAKQLARRRYSRDSFERGVDAIYEWVASERRALKT